MLPCLQIIFKLLYHGLGKTFWLLSDFHVAYPFSICQLTENNVKVKKVKGKVTLFNIGSSFSYEAGTNGSRRCALYPPPSVSAPFYGYLKLLLHGSEKSQNRRVSHRGSNQGPLAPKPAH